MNDFSDGELKFTNREKLEAWLQTQPRDVSVVIAARAALRALPLLHRWPRRDPRDFATLIFAYFWAGALARGAAKYPTRANEFGTAASAAAFAADAASAGAASAAASAATFAAATAANAAGGSGEAAAYVAYAAAHAATHAAASAADVWEAVNADANRLKRWRPAFSRAKSFGSEGLLPIGCTRITANC